MSAQRAKHYPACPANADDTTNCVCEELENLQVKKASAPSAADLIRLAKNRGLLKSHFEYEG